MRAQLARCHSERSEESRSDSKTMQDSSLRPLESHVIPAKAGIQLVPVTWTPAFAGVPKR